ncbi:MAG: hypothetical protein ACLQU2_12680 [Candidatus Binataceae bacterium]
MLDMVRWTSDKGYLVTVGQILAQLGKKLAGGFEVGPERAI